MIKVFLIDDSAVVRQSITTILEKEHSIELIGSASDPIFAKKHMEKQWPDVIILDIEMPRQDGISYLKELMSERPTPVVICSSVAKEGSKSAVDALFLGATEVIHKPRVDIKEFFEDSRETIVAAIKSAHSARRKVGQLKPLVIEKKESPDIMLKCSIDAVRVDTEKVIVIGASTGGVQAVEEVLKNLPCETPGILIVQHMPSGFTKSFANRLNSVCKMDVKEAEHGDIITRGKVFIAPGDRHLMLKREDRKYFVDVKDGPKVSRHKPSVDVLFRSAANEAGKNAIGVILTGMGDDGAIGMKEMRDKGAKTIAQDESTSIVYGMPKEAFELGGVGEVLKLNEISRKLY